jgi:hypothetical protein
MWARPNQCNLLILFKIKSIGGIKRRKLKITIEIKPDLEVIKQ